MTRGSDVILLVWDDEGYASVNTMLFEEPFSVAHRGGSFLYPEMSAYAYKQSAPKVGALEFSCGRSSDGVWFGLHDQYLDRTSLGAATTTLDPNLMTWAEIQQYKINQFGRSEPYYRLGSFLETYGNSHVLFIDPKWCFVNGFLDELWPQLQDIYPGRIVIKFSANSQFVADQAAANGFASWGFMFDTDAANIPTWGAYSWTMLGMEVHTDGTVNSANWDAVKAFGKPVIGHILSNQSMVDGALLAGADGVMLSNPTLSVVMPDAPPPAPDVQILSGAGDYTTFGSTDTQPDANLVPVPANAAIGDLLVTVICAQTDPADFTAPAGWTVSNLSGFARNLAIASYPITDQAALDALGSTVDFEFVTTTTPRIAASMFRVTGADLTAPLQDFSVGSSSASTTGDAWPAFTATAPGAVVYGSFSQLTRGTEVGLTTTWDNGVAGLPISLSQNVSGALSGLHLGWKQQPDTAVAATTDTISVTAAAALAPLRFTIKAA